MPESACGTRVLAGYGENRVAVPLVLDDDASGVAALHQNGVLVPHSLRVDRAPRAVDNGPSVGHVAPVKGACSDSDDHDSLSFSIFID